MPAAGSILRSWLSKKVLPSEGMSHSVSEQGGESYELNIFHDIAKALTSSLDLDTVLQTIMEKMAAYFEPGTWSLLMLDEPTGELYYEASVGKGCECINSLQLKSGQSLARWVIEHAETLVIPNVDNDPRIEPPPPDMCPSGCSVVCMPVRRAGKVLGIIQLMAVDMAVYNRNERLLQTLADYAAIAIENARAVHRIQELSITDDITGLYNARHLFTVLNQEMRRSERFKYEVSLLFLDLDHFKMVNDEHGHLAGSNLLGQVGKALRESLRLVDTAFRYGGDEFAILLPRTSRDAALLVARRIMKMLHSRNWPVGEGATLPLRASIGIAVYPFDAKMPQALVQTADEMMYLVKQSGRNNIAVAGAGIVGLDGSRP